MEKREYTTKSGVKQFKPIATMDEFMAGNMGFCLACGNEQDGCEPDARKYTCELCGKPKVYGLEELAMMGLATVKE